MIRSVFRVAIGLAVLVPGVGLASAEPVHARLVLSAAQGGAPASPQPVAVEVRTGGEVRRLTAALPGEMLVDLPPGVAFVQVVSDAHWSGSRAFDVRRDGEVMPLEVHPAGVVAGTVVLTDGKEALLGASVIFIAHDRTVPWSRSVTVPCAVTALRWSCVLPAGVHDVRLRVPGYISEYYWKTTVAAGKRLDLGVAKLLRGASLVGTVVADHAPRDARPAVRLEPLRLAMGEPSHLRNDVVRADECGFFHFDGVAPGVYSVVATLPGYAPATENAQVVEGRESELLAPLRIEKAKAVELSVEPAVDPSGNRWGITIMARRAGAFHENVTQGAAGMDGRFGWKGARGDYAVQVRSVDGRLWTEESFAIDRDPTRVVVAIQPQAIQGVVRLAGHPLRARLAFGYRSGPEVESGEDGRFSALVPPPRDGVWEVTVNSESAGVQREVRVPAPKEPGEVLIELPGARIAGVVRDEQGQGVEDAIVTVTDDRMDDRPLRTQVRSGPGGVFQAGGLAGNSYKLAAEGAIGRSETVEVMLRENDDQRTELILHPHRFVRGTVSSPYGPVSGAELYVVPLQGTITNRLYYSDAAGEFTAMVPPGTDAFDIAVSAPGFARTFFRTQYQSGRKLHIQVSQAGGTLTLDLPESFRSPAATWTYLLRGEARIVLGVAQRWGVVQTPSSDGRYTLEVPQLEPGPYVLCATASGGIENAGPLDPRRCVSGVLAPYGRLALRLDQ